MRAKFTAVTVAGALVLGGGVGYVAGGTGSDSAAAQSPAAKSESRDHSMMSGGARSMWRT